MDGRALPAPADRGLRADGATRARARGDRQRAGACGAEQPVRVGARVSPPARRAPRANGMEGSRAVDLASNRAGAQSILEAVRAARRDESLPVAEGEGSREDAWRDR